MEGRPWVSGIFLGLLTYKPQLGVLFPLALLASRSWRALGSTPSRAGTRCNGGNNLRLSGMAVFYQLVAGT